jgi:hypothetical protein
MPIQIEQKMPRCARCGKLVHERDLERVELGGRVFCSTTCRDEYLELQPSLEKDGESGPAVAAPSERGVRT